MKYTLLSRILHWLMALLIFLDITLGIYMKDFIDEDAENRFTFYDIHKSIGILVLILLILRVVNRLIKSPPALPQSIPALEKKLAKIGHLALYILMFSTPVSGYLMSSFAGYPVKLFGLTIPSIVATNFDYAKIMSEAHEISAFTLIGIIAIHILGAFKHRFFDKPENDVLKRII